MGKKKRIHRSKEDLKKELIEQLALLKHSCQAFDSGFHNYWYQPDVKIGNYWSNKGSKKTYAIDGDANNQDLHPLKDPVIYPPDSFSWKTSFPNFLVFLLISILGFQTLRKRKRN